MNESRLVAHCPEFANFSPKISRFAFANIADSGSQFDCPSGKKSTEEPKPEWLEFTNFHPKIVRFALANIADSGSQFDCPSGKKSNEWALCFDKKTVQFSSEYVLQALY